MASLLERKRAFIAAFDGLDNSYPIPRHEIKNLTRVCAQWEALYVEFQQLGSQAFSRRFACYFLSVGSSYYSHIPNYERAAALLVALQSDPRYKKEDRSHRAVNECWIGFYRFLSGERELACKCWIRTREIFGKFRLTERTIIGSFILDQLQIGEPLPADMLSVVTHILRDEGVSQHKIETAQSSGVLILLREQIRVREQSCERRLGAKNKLDDAAH